MTRLLMCGLDATLALCSRANAQVFSSTGQPYPGAEGSVVRRQFKKLPGVGAATAQRWWKMGFGCGFLLGSSCSIAHRSLFPAPMQPCSGARGWCSLTQSAFSRGAHRPACWSIT